MNNNIDNLKKRLIYRSQYRGTKEMDKLIGDFVKSVINQLDVVQLGELEKFLNIDDDTLYKFYNNEITKIDIQSNIIKLFKEFKFEK